MMALPTIAIVGCGAVTSRYYVPALTSLRDRLNVVGLYDSDASRVQEVARRFPNAQGATSFDALLDMRASIVILASPPSAHADQAIAALERGSHVLCEKPLAPSAEDASAMAAAAAAHDRLLCVNMVRRHFPASRIVETLVSNESMGAVLSIHAFEGGPFRWPIRDQSYFSQAVSGGGVLADVGTHVVDLLTGWFGEAGFVGYGDDAMGGVEANALLHLTLRGAPATIRLSRDWGRPNGIELTFEKGSVRWRPEPMHGVEVTFEGEKPLWMEDAAARAFGFVDCFAAQIEGMLDHVAGRPARLVTAQQAVPTVALIERAYRERRVMDMPWLEGAHG